MTNAWDPEITVGEDLARRLILRQFPGLEPATLALVGNGWDNTVFLVNGEYVFRFPRRAIAVPLIENEIRVLPYLATQLSTKIPTPVFHGAPDEEFGWPFCGYSVIAGDTACRFDWSDEDRASFARPIASFLKSLHTVSVENLVSLGAGPDPMSRFDFALRLGQIRTGLEHKGVSEALGDTKGLLKIATEATKLEIPEEVVAVHGDLYARHLIVEEDRSLSGIIDWGDFHLGPAATDLAVVHAFLPPEAHAEFRRAYGEIDPVTWELSKFRAINHSLAISIYGITVGDEAMKTHGIQALRYLSQREK